MKSLIKCLGIVVLTGIFPACKKYLDVNESPNAATKPPINGLLINTTQNTALNVFRVANTTSYYVQYLANTSLAGATDTYEPIDASSTWTALYSNMTDIYDLQRFAQEQGATKYQGVAKIMMAMNLQLVHNLWGAAPYSAAFTGEALTAKYDDAQTVFQTCLSLLDEGIALINNPAPTINLQAAADLIHHGKPEAWIRSAHAIKARLLNQLSKTAQYNATAILSEVASAYNSTADDGFITTFNIRNPWNQAAVNNAALSLDGWLSSYYINAMDTTDKHHPSIYGIFDPRLPFTASLTKDTLYRGTRNGGDRIGNGTSKEESYISLTGYYSNTYAPLYIVTYEEMKFIEAEAALRSNDKPKAYAAYLNGISANMNKLEVTEAARNQYINDTSVSVGAANLTLSFVFKEKYKALFLMPVSWDDARRFDYNYKDFVLPLNAATTTFVRRLVYPTVETSRNGDNVPPVTNVTQHLWWDQ